jgi:putative CocE/NonD family hydrolase
VVRHDITPTQTLTLFNLYRTNAVSERSREHQYCIMSPMNHCRSEDATDATCIGARAVGAAGLPYDELYLRWFDHWLKGEPNGVTEMPKLRIFVMGRNEWRGEAEWPLARTVWTPYYLHSDGRANSRYGDGVLSTAPPVTEQHDSFVYDPLFPVPTVGGPICCTGGAVPEGGYDQSEVEMRADVLVYTTRPLEQGVEITGPLEAVLYVSSSAPDTDFTAKLVDVYPDGTAYILQEGILRARYREGLDRTVWMEPDGVYEVRIDLEATSNWFSPGHRIRLDISSSSFPRWDRNLNTGGNNYDEAEANLATNRVHHSARYPSRIVLPVIPHRAH